MQRVCCNCDRLQTKLEQSLGEQVYILVHYTQESSKIQINTAMHRA